MKKVLAGLAVMTFAFVALGGSAHADQTSIPPGIEDNGAIFGPAACTDGTTRTLVHANGVSAWSEDGGKWKLVVLDVDGTFTDLDGNVVPISVRMAFGESNGLTDPVDCSFHLVQETDTGTVDVVEVGTFAPVG